MLHRRSLEKPDGRALHLYSRQAIPEGIQATAPKSEGGRGNPHLYNASHAAYLYGTYVVFIVGLHAGKAVAFKKARLFQKRLIVERELGRYISYSINVHRMCRRCVQISDNK